LADLRSPEGLGVGELRAEGAEASEGTVGTAEAARVKDDFVIVRHYIPVRRVTMAKRAKRATAKRATAKRAVGVPKKRSNSRISALRKEYGPSLAGMRSRKSEGSKETAYLLSSPVNAKELLSAIAEANAGKFIEGELIDE
jgi:hypothetical protein